VDTLDLPGLGRKVSRIGAGCWTIGGPATNNGIPIGWDDVDEDAAYEGLQAALEAGITLFDTADVYGLGRSERLLGRLLRETDREDIVLSGKVGYFAGTAAHPYLPRQMLHQFATTLDNLGTSYLDLYHLHSTDFGPRDTHLGPAITTVLRLREQGRIRAVGMRAPHRFALERASDPRHPLATETRRFLHLFRSVRPDVLTVRHNLMCPLYGPGETDIFAFARREGVGVLVKQTLGQGLLLGARRPGGFSVGDHRSRKPVEPGLARAIAAAVKEIRQRFGTDRRDLARAALGYVLHEAPEAAVLVGFRDGCQITEVLSRTAEPLTGDDMTFLQKAMSPVREKLATTGLNATASSKN
jgi:aryl-alcohol dehydrogenase-like predicted oxidoreductase